MKVRIGTLASAAFLLAACDHHDALTDSAPPAAESPYTGLPSKYPRAQPVSLPAATNVVQAPVAPLAEPPATSAPEPPLSPNPSPVAEPAPSVDASATAPPVTAPLETIPPSPPIATLPPRPMGENEAKKQVVVLETSQGRIVIELDDVAAPRTCGNFRKLVANGFYNHTIFHRVLPHFIVQGGDPNSKNDDRRTYGLGDPGYTLPAEIALKHVAGAVAMARLPDATNPQKDSNGSQFYICVADCPSLDDKYTVFGHVIRGLDTALKISNSPRDKQDDPYDRIEMQATLETKQQALAENPQ